MAATLLIVAQLAVLPAVTSEWVEFLGFSRDGRLAAYRHDIHERRDDGTHDQYSLVHTMDVRSGARVATFRASAIHRIGTDGRPAKIRRAELHGDNPRFREAYPNKRWERLKARLKLSHLAVPMNLGVVEAQVDDDTPANSQVAPEAIHFATTPGQPLGFGATVRDGTGTAMVLARHRHQSAPKEMTVAKLQAFISRSGHAVALVTLFLFNDGQTPRSLGTVDIKRLDEPLPLQNGRKASRRTRQGDRGFDPWHSKVGLGPDPSVRRNAAGARDKVDPRERRQLEALYTWFSGQRP